MTGRRLSPFVMASALVILLGTAVLCEVARDRIYGEPKPAQAVLYFKSGTALKRMAMSYSSVLADVYWIRALQYYGGTRLSSVGQKDYALLYPLLDITTTLDPDFSIAYRFGAIFLAEGYPGGPGRPDQAVDLLRKGFRNSPDNWHYLQDIGFVYYWWLGDYREAAAWFQRASGIPGAPWWLKSLAAVTAAQGGDRRSSRLLWQALLTSTDNDWLRNSAAMRLQQLDAMDQIDWLQARIRTYASRFGRFPASWLELARAKYVAREPTDPTGIPYTLDPGSGVVAVSRDSRLFPLPTGQPTRTSPVPR